ncbi:MAG: nodulation protein NfeD, partial [Rhodospirillaceae bacterium]|nr:nodulation protein NfeD [Rhodospirillaceae bacterium]
MYPDTGAPMSSEALVDFSATAGTPLEDTSKIASEEMVMDAVENCLKAIENYNIEKFELGSTENIISLFLNPIVSSVLILLIIGGLYFELQTPGI